MKLNQDLGRVAEFGALIISSSDLRENMKYIRAIRYKNRDDPERYVAILKHSKLVGIICPPEYEILEAFPEELVAFEDTSDVETLEDFLISYVGVECVPVSKFRMNFSDYISRTAYHNTNDPRAYAGIKFHNRLSGILVPVSIGITAIEINSSEE